MPKRSERRPKLDDAISSAFSMLAQPRKRGTEGHRGSSSWTQERTGRLSPANLTREKINAIGDTELHVFWSLIIFSRCIFFLVFLSCLSCFSFLSFFASFVPLREIFVFLLTAKDLWVRKSENSPQGVL
jgi:hypothetical protein